MIIRCPSCDTQYDLPAGTIGDTGRMVSCVRCAQRWMVPAESPRKDEPPPEVQIVEPFDIDDIEFGDIDVLEERDSKDLSATMAVSTPSGQAKNSRRRQGGGLIRRRVVIKRKEEPSRFSVHAMIMGVAIALVFFGISMRESVVAFMPRTAALYELAGLPVNLVGLDFEGLTWSKQSDNGTPVLVVTGRIVNVSQVGAYVPAIRLGLVDSADQELFAWTAESTAEILPPGGTTEFTARLASPPDAAVNVSVRFTPHPMPTSGAATTLGMKQ